MPKLEIAGTQLTHLLIEKRQKGCHWSHAKVHVCMYVQVCVFVFNCPCWLSGRGIPKFFCLTPRSGTHLTICKLKLDRYLRSTIDSIVGFMTCVYKCVQIASVSFDSQAFIPFLSLRGPMSQICDVHVLHSLCRANKQKIFVPCSGYMTRVSIGIQGWFPPSSIKEITGNIYCWPDL